MESDEHLFEEGAELEDGDFALFVAHGQVLASAVRRRQAAHGDAAQHVRRQQLPDRLALEFL